MIQEYFSRISEFKEQLEAIGDTIDEDELIMTALNGLTRPWDVLRFGYLGKWSPCAYESLSTKGEDFYPHTLLYDSNFTLT
jgi:hypothetical protein